MEKLIEGNILTTGTTYNIERDMHIIDSDKKTGEKMEWVYPKGTVATIMKHKMWREGAFRGVDYVIKMPDGYTLEESSKVVHRILGIPFLKVKKK